MKKQKVIDLIEAMEDQKEKNEIPVQGLIPNLE